VQPVRIAKPSAVLLDFYGTMARATSRGPLAGELFGRRGLAFDQELWDRHRWDALDGLDHQQFSGTREDYEAWEVDRLRRLLERVGLPVKIDGVTPYVALEHMRIDKKVQSGRMRLVLLRAIGDSFVTADYSEQALQRTLGAYFG